jgi:hypothetical protein
LSLPNTYIIQNLYIYIYIYIYIIVICFKNSGKEGEYASNERKKENRRGEKRATKRDKKKIERRENNRIKKNVFS